MDHKRAAVSASPWIHRGLATNLHPSDPSDPNKSTEQILAIYPIIPGQKPRPAAKIPPRHEAAAPRPKNDDLINFGPDDSSADTQRPPMLSSGGDPKVESSGEISELLKATGKPSEGPLIDFQDDLKTNLPI